MRNRAAFLIILSVFFGIQLVNGQAKKKKMPRNINMLGYDNFGPAVSGDGNSMVYMSNYTNDGSVVLMYTKKASASSWKDPEELPRIINIPHLTFMHGYCLNFDGSELYFTFKKSGGLGGYDLWMVKRAGNAWNGAKNLGSPLNGSLNDGSPSISSDGKSLYFMSCETMTNDKASGCQLMMSTRSNKKSKWRKPTPLSSQINKGNTLSPNILADGETLMYLSDHEGSTQWYMTRFEEENWIEPRIMDFLEVNDQRNISIPAKGRYVFHDIPAERGSIIEQLLIPEAFKPKDVMRIIGTILSAEGGTMKVYDVDTRKRIIFETLADGDSYDFVLIEGSIYDVSFDTTDPTIPAVSELFDLTEIKFSSQKKWNVKSQSMNVGDSLEMKALRFDTITMDVGVNSIYELRRLTRFLSKSQGEYEVNIFHYPLDTATMVELSMEIDSLDINKDSYMAVNDSLISVSDSNMDSTMEILDTVLVEVVAPIITPTMAEVLANTLKRKLVEKNIPEDQCFVNGITLPMKELEGNEELADQLLIYLKKIN